MAIYFVTDLLSNTDYIKFSPRYSSVNSAWQDMKGGFLKGIKVGGKHCVLVTPEQVLAVYPIPNRDELRLISGHMLPPGLKRLRLASRQAGVDETTLLQ